MNKLLNYFGLYTREQYLSEMKKFAMLNEYAIYLEKAVDGMTDPSKPIVVLSDNVRVSDIILQHGQQIIVSRYAKYVTLDNISTSPKPTGGSEG